MVHKVSVAIRMTKVVALSLFLLLEQFLLLQFVVFSRIRKTILKTKVLKCSRP